MALSDGAQGTGDMTKRIVVFSDGTGNAVANVWRSNVWRVFESLDLTGNEQVAYYDDGVGTSAFKPLAILGGAFGWGLKRNVLDLYEFICRHYGKDTEIFAFGFSRGAFTIRVLMGLIDHQGLIRFRSEADLSWKVRAAYRAYRAARYETLHGLESCVRRVRDFFVGLKNRIAGRAPYRSEDNDHRAEIRFVGVWDTVAAYGLPIDEMTIGVSKYLWPLELPNRTLSPKVKRACHALALDDERTTFHPLLWTEPRVDPDTIPDVTRLENERLSQVWFPGVHSNVGGGYPDDSLAHLPLFWIMGEAEKCGLKFKSRERMEPDAFRRTKSSRDKDGRLEDSRRGLGGYYRYGPRKIAELSHAEFSKASGDAVDIDLPKIHESAFKRIKSGNVYAPIGLPARYAVVDDEEWVLKGPANPYEKTPAQAQSRANAQERVWNTVWWRRVVYFLTVAASFHLAAFPLLYKTVKADEHSSWISWVGGVLRTAESVLPGFAGWWIESFATNPWKFLLGLAVLAGFMFLGIHLGRRITDGMLTLWRTAPVDAALPTDAIYKLRTSHGWKRFIGIMKREVFPGLSALAIVYCVLALLSQVSFKVLDAAGMYCTNRKDPRSHPPAPREPPTPFDKTISEDFSINDMCAATGIELVEGERYVVTLKRKPPEIPWQDGAFTKAYAFPVDNIAGYEIPELDTPWERAWMYAIVPWRRVLLRPWLRPIVRIGATGTDEYFMDPPVATPLRKTSLEEVTTTFRARQTGELFLYVNDAVIGIPGKSAAGFFYRKNQGTAIVSVCYDKPLRSCEAPPSRQ
jgi:uncharacterized protein (DUF2235 family)